VFHSYSVETFGSLINSQKEYIVSLIVNLYLCVNFALLLCWHLNLVVVLSISMSQVARCSTVYEFMVSS
jgi:hypothetical protein